LPASSENGGLTAGHRGKTTRSTVSESPLIAAERLAGWLEHHRFVGPDPYSGLAGRRAQAFRGAPISAQAVIQATKRFPRLARALFGSSDVAMAKTMALVLSAYAVLDHRPSARVSRMRAQLLGRRTPSGGFGYEFPVVTRWGSYGEGEPNLVATAFALQGLADAAQLAGDAEAATSSLDLARFALSHFCVQTSFFAYHQGSSILVHNANVLACGQVTRAFRGAGLDTPDEVFAAARLSVDAQRPDGAWPYAEHPRCGWIDTFHTLYILEGLHELARTDPDGPWVDSFDRGLTFVYTHCLTDEGPLELPDRNDRPLEGHTVGTALSFFARRTTDRNVLSSLLRGADALVRDDGSFAAHASEKGGYGPAYPRWVGAHMLAGLAAAAAALDGHLTP